jgi:acyl-CoA synthetase (AMP-forming)/AMP-acid ligase II
MPAQGTAITDVPRQFATFSASGDRVAVALHSINPGEIGELCAPGGNFMDCYWNRPEQTESAFRPGWYHSGDAGYMDNAGTCFSWIGSRT